MTVDVWKSEEVPICGVDHGPVSLGEGGDLGISHQVACGPASSLQQLDHLLSMIGGRFQDSADTAREPRAYVARCFAERHWIGVDLRVGASPLRL